MKYIRIVIKLVLLPLLAALINALKVGRKPGKPKVLDSSRYDKYARDLARMIRRRTIAKEAEKYAADFEGFNRDLAELFPAVHAKLEKIELGGALLYRWPGKDSGREPILLMSHLDVVDSEGEWQQPAFEGVIRDGIIWGRGAVDTKGPLCAIFNAVEELLGEGFMPERDVYIASSHNEEILGDGALKTVEYFKAQGIRLEMVMDEGGAVIDPPMPGIKNNFAMIAMHEKGRATLRFTAKAPVSHSLNVSIGAPLVNLAHFVAQVDSRPPFIRKLNPQVRAMFGSLAPYMGLPQRLLFANLWLFGPLFVRLMPKVNESAAAMLGTTIVFTQASGSDSPQVAPKEATITGYLRYTFKEDLEIELENLRELALKHDIEMEVLEIEPYAVPSDVNSPVFSYVRGCINEVLPDVGVAPFILLAGTDARRYSCICDNLIRFAPIRINDQQLKSVHNIDENISIKALGDAVHLYKRIIRGYR